jgi:hypothetical protein
MTGGVILNRTNRAEPAWPRFQRSSVGPHARCIWVRTAGGSVRPQVGAGRWDGDLWGIDSMHRWGGNTAADLTTPLPRRDRNGRRGAKLSQPGRRIFAELKAAVSARAALHRVPSGWCVSGLVASRAIDAFGWQSLFFIGGILPLSLSMVLIRALPDSIEFLVMRGAAWREIRNLVVRIDPTAHLESGCQFVIDGEKKQGVPVRQLFLAGLAGGTVLLWASSFINFMMLVGSSTWAPTLL